MAWLMELVQGAVDLPVAIDSANPEAAKVGLSMAQKAGRKPILNSISLEKHRLKSLLPIAQKNECMVVALLMSDGGTPSGVDDRLASAEKLIGRLTGAGKKLDEIIVDPCFLPVSADQMSGRRVVEAIAATARRGDQVLVMSNGGFGGIHARLLKRLAE